MAGMAANLRWCPGAGLSCCSTQTLQKEYLLNVICDPMANSPLTSSVSIVLDSGQCVLHKRIAALRRGDFRIGSLYVFIAAHIAKIRVSV
jgi:hypothetical protein